MANTVPASVFGTMSPENRGSVISNSASAICYYEENEWLEKQSWICRLKKDSNIGFGKPKQEMHFPFKV